METGTKQFRKRNAILSCLRGATNHPSAEMVYQMLHSQHPDISLATVYRNLAWFKQQGIICSLGSVDGVERFDPCTDPHVHFICTGCGEVLDLPEVEMPEAQMRQAQRCSGGCVESCQLTFTGLCRSCANQENKQAIAY